MQIDDLKLILKVAECRSITLAAAKLDMRTATASAAIKRVESALGCELFIRTTRHLRLSSAGERYIPQCEQALAVLETARQNLKGEHDAIEGELREVQVAYLSYQDALTSALIEYSLEAVSE